MAKVQEIIYTDDYTGEQLAAWRPDAGPKPASTVRTVKLAVDGHAYELHLSEQSRAALEEALRPFIADAVGDKLPTRSHHVITAPPRRRATVDREQSRAMRAWWADNWKAAGLDEPSSARGRIPAAVVEAYHRYGGAPVPQPTSPSRPKGRRAKSSAKG